MIAELPLLHLQIERNIGVDAVLELAVLRTVFSIITRPFSSNIRAGMRLIVEHSGQSDSVIFGSPFSTAELGPPVSVFSGCKIFRSGRFADANEVLKAFSAQNGNCWKEKHSRALLVCLFAHHGR